MSRLVEENERDRLLINNLDNISTINSIRNGFSHKVQKFKIALLWSSYDRSDSVFKGNDPAPTGILECNPDPEKYEFHLESIDKHTAISTIQNFIEAKKCSNKLSSIRHTILWSDQLLNMLMEESLCWLWLMDEKVVFIQ
uniref:Uncharacterized protein n=1 Tax=Romanomermis culicivorax TaxID=13658 RepID=A0A915KIW7_ROMCU